MNRNSLLLTGYRLFFILLILVFSPSAYAVKSDIVYLKNGDRVTGEVKTLYRGKLEFSTDGMGTVYIEWADIENMISKTGQAIEITNGQRYYGTQANFNTEITTQDAADSTQRSNLGLMHNIFQLNKKYHSYFASLERNDQLGLDLRALLGAGYGWVPIRSQKNWFMLAAGLDINREIPTDGERQTNLEAILAMNYEYFKYSSPERSFNTELQVFPSITDWGRWRENLDTNFRWELFSDLYWTLAFYASFDSAPISPEASTNDYGVTSSLGYKF